jgi:hypothetical protein
MENDNRTIKFTIKGKFHVAYTIYKFIVHIETDGELIEA